ncbi:unnamed protein product [Spirodela intermedia]|uniref:Metallothionein-like protein n=1 Tax=Spirodela intermedia TaxID=51605 RepID=A0A7I8ID52_SPIIN|nr:unnamed protein product [Spirodela intermedia]CAA6654972.1 unnamed protein product [Spirodela intermedia]
MPCGCGSNCSCGSGCRCETQKTPAPTEVLGVAPEKRSTAVASAREGCRCGSSCRCNPCNC